MPYEPKAWHLPNSLLRPSGPERISGLERRILAAPTWNAGQGEMCRLPVVTKEERDTIVAALEKAKTNDSQSQ